MVMRTAKPQILAELHALEEFISEGWAHGSHFVCYHGNFIIYYSIFYPAATFWGKMDFV